MPPGVSARPFTDFREEINKLPPGQQGRLVGRGNLQLIESGKVRWEDVVTRGRIRTLGEVVQRGKLTREDLIGAGLSGPRADAALGATRAAGPANAARKAAIEKLRSLGLTDAEIKQAIKDRLRARVGIGRGPSGGNPPPTPRPLPPPPLPPIDRALDYAKARGIAAKVDGEYFRKLFGPKAVARMPGAYNSDDRTIYLNPLATYWGSPEAYAQHAVSSGWWSSASPDYVVHHEVGHALHHRATGDDFWVHTSPLRKALSAAEAALIRYAVSQYGATSPTEFVAEAYAAMVAGKSYDAGIMDLYRKYRGPTSEGAGGTTP